ICPSGSAIGSTRKSLKPDGRPSVSRATRPKNQRPVSATPMNSPPGERNRKEDMLPNFREEAVISRPPTNSSGPKRRSWEPILNSVIGRLWTVMEAGDKSPATETCDRVNMASARAASEMRPLPPIVGSAGSPEYAAAAAPACALLLEQGCKLLGHGAGQLLGIDDGHRAPVVTRYVMTDAYGQKLDGRARLDEVDDG